MEKYLITKRSYNPKTGPIMVTTTSHNSCPRICPLRKNANTSMAGACFAEHGVLGNYLWPSLDRTPAGGTFQKGRIKVHGFDTLLAAIRAQPENSIWRHNQAGDLPTADQINISRGKVRQITKANRGRRGFTYTHYDVIHNHRNRYTVAEANHDGFTINLSGNSLDHADLLADTSCGPVTVLLPSDHIGNTCTRNGRKVIICPAHTHPGITCATCKLCARQRSVIIGFPAHGRGKSRIT